MYEDKKLFEKNLNAFRQIFPEAAEILETYKPESIIFHHEDGGPDLSFREVTLYGEDGRAFCEKQIKAYWERPHRIALNPPDTKTLDEFSNAFTFRTLKRATQANMEFALQHQDKRSHQLVVYGIGLGLHLLDLVEATQCRSLILVEPNHEFLYQSMHMIDWTDILNSLMEREAFIKLLISTSPRYISDWVRVTLRRNNPAAVDGSYIYPHYDNAVFGEAQRIFGVESGLILSGLGFFRDEMGMLTNTFGNLKDGTSRIHNKIGFSDKRVHDRRDIPVFIIGSGPSLDNDMDFIKANQDRAVIFSSGTALRPLLTAGVKPDVHVELERGTPPMELLTKLSEEFGLGGIILMGSSTIDPRIKDLFDDTIFFFRSALSPYPIFGDRMTALDIPGPTVANTSLSLAQELGFRNFYSFGVDFGARDPDRHHSVASDYFGEMEAEEEKAYQKPMPANLGGEVFTGFILQWAKDAFENAIEKYPRNIYYNCSDGVVIDRTIPKLSETIELPDAPRKAKVIEGIKEYAPVYEQSRFRDLWRDADIFSELEDLAALLCDIVDDKKHENHFVITKKMTDHLIKDSEEDTPPSALVYRGTLFMVMTAFHFYSNRLTDRDRLDEFREIYADEFRTEMETLKGIALETMRGLDDTLPESDDAEGTVISFG